MAQQQQDTLTIARQLFETWNAHDPNAVITLLASDYVSESDTLPTTVRGPAAAQQVFRMYLAAFPDLAFTIEHVTAANEVATVRWRATGTHRGDLMGIAATQRRGEVRGCSILEIKNGKITHEWLYWDTGHLLRQLGVLPERTMTAGR